MDEYKISQAEINENNVKSAADLVSAEDYGGNAREVKGIFDKLPELIVARFNAFIDSVIAKFKGYYTKEETDQAINNKVADLGAGDMAKAVYDTDNNGKVDFADNADLLRGYWLSQYDADGNKTDELYAHYYEDSETGEIIGGVAEDFEENAVLYVPQELTEEQKAVARENIGAGTDIIYNYGNDVIFNHTDKITVQVKSFIMVGKVCTFCLQFIVNETITDSYGFTMATLPKPGIGRIWINNETKFFVETAEKDIRVNSTSIAKGNYIWTGTYITSN